MEFGKRLIDCRKALRMRQQDLSTVTGINQPRISRIERNKVSANTIELTKFAHAFKITESELLDEKTRVTLEIAKQKG